MNFFLVLTSLVLASVAQARPIEAPELDLTMVSDSASEALSGAVPSERRGDSNPVVGEITVALTDFSATDNI
ncbi:hypothetical protein PSV09DRAFT_2396132 [Bipolaris maydis]|uniref:uncharacterized protein n=1 Tax=Cochliobolus heterostrophus TaxID=5016 RepID=UPI0024D557AB|nr:hypothetical protein J3E73DRAFT_365646 [Bipolaris maydis]KAJ6213623.1 hypothetical protein PSV09DRAFT_2396132 [Bipolaris maydis]KAJ6274840.1 hypothetical protein PSV08DRAFT_347598 [Bipolaris maydis]KAJ6285876.1 hypothetical protein J3E71DRAFT_338012 [Bipolaris maydis]